MVTKGEVAVIIMVPSTNHEGSMEASTPELIKNLAILTHYSGSSIASLGASIFRELDPTQQADHSKTSNGYR